jgi:hypothetical protein
VTTGRMMGCYPGRCTRNNQSAISQAQVRAPRLEAVDVTEIDVILCSNWHTCLGLPYVTEDTGFSGKVWVREMPAPMQCVNTGMQAVYVFNATAMLPATLQQS